MPRYLKQLLVNRVVRDSLMAAYCLALFVGVITFTIVILIAVIKLLLLVFC